MNINTLKKYQPIYVIGHSKPDADTILSSKVLSDIFNDNGIESYYAILENNYDLTGSDKNMINDCLSYNPIIIKNEDKDKVNYFLVDHNDPAQSVGYDCNVIGCIDHHVDSNKINNKLLFSYCSTALSIYNMFKDDYSFSNEQLNQLYYATLSDSTFYKSSRFENKDKNLIIEMGFNEDVNALFRKYFKGTDLSEGIEVAFNNGYKKYDLDGIKFESSYIETFDEKGLDKYINLIENYENNFLGLWIDYNNIKTYAYFKYNDNIQEFEYDLIASRATTVMNDVLNYLNNDKTKKKVANK
jgi:inorganic pyrophosphatase/exopolyphosphatase